MSNYARVTRHPKTGEFLPALWLDDHFGRHHYGVQFPDGEIFDERAYRWAFEDEPGGRSIVADIHT